MIRVAVFTGVLAWSVAALTAASGPSAEAQIPTKFTNLQVLPTDIAPRPLIDLMRSFAQGLGVRCEHCHVGEGNDLSKFDFAADTKPTKATARKMLGMTSAINGELLAGVGEPAAPGAPKVTCYTCHRGSTKPLTVRPPGTTMEPMESSRTGFTPCHERNASELSERAARTERGSWGPASERVGGSAGAKPPGLSEQSMETGAAG